MSGVQACVQLRVRAPGSMATVTGPKFLFLEGSGDGESSRPAWPGSGFDFAGEVSTAGSWVAWRLIGSNHRELGRSRSVFPDVGLARVSAVNVVEAIVAASTQIRTVVPGGQWSWRVSLGGDIAAVSSRSYSRQREAAYSLNAFIAAVPLAELSEVVAGFRHQVPWPRPSEVNAECTPDEALPLPASRPQGMLGEPNEGAAGSDVALYR